MQAAYLTKNRFTATLSPQGMLGCTPNPRKCGGTGGCDGATPELGFEWAQMHGLQTLDAQDYTAKDGCPRSFLEARPTVKIAGYVRLPENKADQMFNALVSAGPLAVAVAASSWHNYDSGIFSGCQSNYVVDHAVTLVGYGKERRKKYWKIKNSWGDLYGEGGFIRLKRSAPDSPEPCGWDTDPQKGVGCRGGPSKLWVCGQCGILSDVAHPVGAEVTERAGF